MVGFFRLASRSPSSFAARSRPGSETKSQQHVQVLLRSMSLMLILGLLSGPIRTFRLRQLAKSLLRPRPSRSPSMISPLQSPLRICGSSRPVDSQMPQLLSPLCGQRRRKLLVSSLRRQGHRQPGSSEPNLSRCTHQTASRARKYQVVPIQPA